MQIFFKIIWLKNFPSPSPSFFIKELALLPDPADPSSIARFLRHTPNLNQSMVGEYLAVGPSKDPSRPEVLKEFVKLFDFTGMRIDDALRAFLEKFKVPG